MRNPALKRVEKWLKLSVLPPIGAAVIRGLGRSMRIDSKGQESIDALYREGKRVIIAFWHAQSAHGALDIPRDAGQCLISQHQDGEIIARIVSRFGIEAVRGSSTRGGGEALRELIRLRRSGVDLVVTPDGPKGPAQVAKWASSNWHGLRPPIVPLAFSCSKKNTLRAGIASWFRILALEVCISGGLPSGFREMLDESGLGGGTAGA